jgi:DNA primase
MPIATRSENNGDGHPLEPTAPVNRLAGMDQLPSPGEVDNPLAKDPNLIDTIQQDIENMGVVGDRDLALLFYVIASSRKQASPGRAIVQGPSSGGKSWPVQRVLSLIPPGDIVKATSLTPQSLYYMEPGSLEHKLIEAGEMSHQLDEAQADKTAALRQLISEGYIAKQVTIKWGNSHKTVFIEQKGPVAFLQTTTCKSIFDEDRNRCLLIHPDVSEEQTERILKAIAKECNEDPRTDHEEAIRRRHHAFQQLLEMRHVLVPFADRLRTNLPLLLETRRAFKQLLAMVRTVTFLHQHQRAETDKGHLISTVDDYKIARELLLAPLTASLDCGQNVLAVGERLRAKFAGEFNSNELLDQKFFNNATTRDRTLNRLRALGVLVRIAAGKAHHPARYAWSEGGLKPLLPLPEDLS